MKTSINFKRELNKKNSSNLYGTPAEGKNSNNDEYESRDPFATPLALGTDRGRGLPQSEQHRNVEAANEEQRHHVTEQEERHLEQGPVVLRQESTAHRGLVSPGDRTRRVAHGPESVLILVELEQKIAGQKSLE